ncbi:MAG TPA: cyclic nucleotide-binding domain-containing protein [Phototrophicaceae bacterium]|nr:cyclic nucleotide-binding domain-containing protein [Phototrophicaceae bacterium]
MKKTLEPLLEKHPFFAGLDQAYLEVLTGCASNLRFRSGEYLFREGDEAKQFFVIREGAVALEVFVPGAGAVTIQTVEEGDVVGWSWLFPPYRWHFSGRVASPLRVLALDGKCLRDKCEQDHDLGYELLKRFSGIMLDRLQATRVQLLDLYGTH